MDRLYRLDQHTVIGRNNAVMVFQFAGTYILLFATLLFGVKLVSGDVSERELLLHNRLFVCGMLVVCASIACTLCSIARGTERMRITDSYLYLRTGQGERLRIALASILYAVDVSQYEGLLSRNSVEIAARAEGIMVCRNDDTIVPYSSIHHTAEKTVSFTLRKIRLPKEDLSTILELLRPKLTVFRGAA